MGLLRGTIKMARGKEHCPNRGSKKITIEKCKVCHFEWKSKIKSIGQRKIRLDSEMFPFGFLYCWGWFEGFGWMSLGFQGF